MKRFVLLTIFFYVCTFASPQRVHAAVPLAAVAIAAVGAACAATSGGVGQFYTKTGVTPSYVPDTVNAGASAKDYLFLPGYLAVGSYNIVTKTTFPMAEQLFLAKTAAIGASVGSIIDTVKNSAESAYSGLKILLDDNKTGGVFDSSIASSMPSGSIVALSNGGNVQLVGPSTYTGSSGTYIASQYAAATYKFPVTGGGCWSVASGVTGEWHCYNGSSYNGTWMTAMWVYAGTSTTAEPTLTPPPYGVNYDGLKTSLSNPSADVASEVSDIISKTASPAATTAASVPSTVASATAAPTLTQAEVNNWFKANTAEVAQAAADAAVAAAAQAAQDAADPDEEVETFSAISDSPFGAAYNPGAFDIPTRFTTFLTNVKASGLFAFSSAYFNSLPGGGSPLLTINGGQTFGTHTFDFSQSLGGGLAILKSVLLALFGFLSIRAIIMKR